MDRKPTLDEAGRQQEQKPGGLAELMHVASPEAEAVSDVTILFCGDSGDGMQLTGTQFTNTSAMFGNDVSTLPDYPSEIRAPAGSLAGVSAFQVRFSKNAIHTPGDDADVLVAMNPAALKVNLGRLKHGGILIANEDAFTKGNLKKAGYEENPLDDAELARRYQLQRVPITTLTMNALEEVELDKRGKQRCKNFMALGLAYWLFDRNLEPTLDWIGTKFARVPAVAQANRLALKGGYNYGSSTGAFKMRYEVGPCEAAPGTYRLISGNEAIALGFVTAARLAGKALVYSTYPITPATDVLHHLAKLKQFDVRTLQMEDEIAGMGAAIGSAFGGQLALTGTSGPGMCLKSEAMNLAMILELPIVILSVQRGGPSTGLPTKTEQSDLLQALFGRNGESPIPVLAARSASDCFDVAIEAFRIAIRHSTPVIVLSDTYVANGAEPWRVPTFEDLEPIVAQHPKDGDDVQPYQREEGTLARPWILPGTTGLQHRLGGLEKEHLTGNVSADPSNHQVMSDLRAEKVQSVADFYPELEVDGPSEGELLVLSWGSTYGAARGAVARLQKAGQSVAHAHLGLVYPFPKNLGQVLSGFKKVLIPELNSGQLALLVRARFLVDAISYNKLQGLPFTVSELEAKIEELLG